jgi:hypothetical protein
MSDDAYDRDDPKHPNYRQPDMCACCTGVNGHYTGCVEVTR